MTNFQEFWTENIVPGAYTHFSKIWPSDLVLQLTWHIYLDFLHLTELKNIYITEIYMIKQYK